MKHSVGRRRRPGHTTSPAAVVAAAVVAVGVVAAAGCSSDTDGSPRAGDGSSGSRSPSTGAMDRYALSPTDFPSSYPAVRLSGAPAAEAMADVTGRPLAGQVDPETCLPQQVPSGVDDAVVLVGQSAAQANLTVITVRVSVALAELSAQVARCATYTVIDGPARSAVRMEALPPSPVASDATLAYRRTLRSSTAPSAPVQTMTTLVAQNADIRVYVEYRSVGSGPPDGAALDELFTAAVSRARGR
ncbi:hypothetical protein [Williamsia sp. CHRR-6]|uniref:hypothetical protein n=1 Tax=Williamsia sp. CHRR-6 TaxID=2835871 RepID=UPI001BD96CA8|nr:hypothetical protein [Williamsia sp. CHRR-6]MBT0567921.1 hypothetical protein [Williamsia sp. CHRR-6]